MKIAVIGSNGRVASLIIKETQDKGYLVTGFSKHDDKNKLTNFIKKDALELTKEDLKDFDVVIDAVGGWDKNSIPNITNVMIHLANILEDSQTRLIIVGGAGSLYVNKERTMTVDMQKDFPESWKPLSNAHFKGLQALRNSKNLNWTYISPACNFIADGKRTNEYKIAGEELELSSKGTSEISYADYAIALVDIINENKYNKCRISVVEK